MSERPRFEDLPLRKGDPPFSAWGLYGDEDQLGTLNLLTEDNTLAAARNEILTGVRLSLDPRIDALLRPSHGRQTFRQTIFQRGANRPVHDDAIEFNTQCGPQWDGLRHLTYMKLGKFYNGTPIEAISGPNPDPSILGIDAWVKNGSIAGRGILIDYLSYAEASDNTYKLIGKGATKAISVSELEACAAYQGVQIRKGDILLVRSGFWKGYRQLSEEGKLEWSTLAPTEWVGLETNIDMARWLWDKGFSAAAGDAPGWERVPNFNTPPEAGLGGLSLHEITIGGWGMPIGEMFDLEALSAECKRQKRYSFFMTSAPLHVQGGVGSPPNTVVIF